MTATEPYTPAVGDRFHKPAWLRKSPLDADPVPMPACNAEVTMVSDKHVVAMIDGREFTMPRGDFITLAERTITNGATLTRSA